MRWNHPPPGFDAPDDYRQQTKPQRAAINQHHIAAINEHFRTAESRVKKKTSDLPLDGRLATSSLPREGFDFRITRVVPNGEAKEGEHLSAGAITIDPARHQVSVGGKRISLTSSEFKLLRTLVQRRGRVQERDRLLNEVWGYESIIDTRTVDTHVRRLREKLGKAGDVIETVRGFGYRLRED